jgi:hypothetical protein
LCSSHESNGCEKPNCKKKNSNPIKIASPFIVHELITFEVTIFVQAQKIKDFKLITVLCLSVLLCHEITPFFPIVNKITTFYHYFKNLYLIRFLVG